jgi:hypothetical protein
MLILYLVHIFFSSFSSIHVAIFRYKGCQQFCALFFFLSFYFFIFLGGGGVVVGFGEGTSHLFYVI